MKARPILFSAPMIRALLAGAKTQTRRVVKPQPGDLDRPFQLDDGSWHVCASRGGHMSPLPCPYGRPGDLLWVRETWAMRDKIEHDAQQELGDYDDEYFDDEESENDG